MKIGYVFDKIKSTQGLKLQKDIAIRTPRYLSKLLDKNDVNASKLCLVVFDKADLGLELTKSEDVQSLFIPNGPLAS